jgi:apolipoprotein N-acyltransferase
VKRIHISAWLWAVTSGVLQVLIFPKPALSFLCWVAITPLIYAVLRAREADASQLLAERDTFSYLVPAHIGQAFVLGWVAGTITYAGTCYWVYNVMHLYGGLPRAVSVLLWALFSLYIGLHQALFAALVAWAAEARAGFSRKALFLAPFLWVAVELLRTFLVGFPWDLLGTAQVGNVPLARIATVTGVYGISFEIALVNTAFAAAFLVRPGRRKNLLTAAITAAIALQATALVRVDAAPHNSTALLVQQNIALNERWTVEFYQETLRDLERISVANNDSASLVVWPESPSPFFLNDNRFVGVLSAVAQRSHAWVIAGSVGTPPGVQGGEDDVVYNSAALVSPTGTVTGRYDKIHLVPWGEYVPFKEVFAFANALTREVGNFEAGSDRTPMLAGDMRIGTFICYESVFPGEIRVFVDRGADLLVNVSNDGWFGNSGAPEQHLNMARMRAIENGRWLLRSTNTGITASIDPMGRVVAVAPRNQRTVLEAPYMPLRERTFYTANGDWFPIACAIISLVGLLWRQRVGPRMAEPQPV